MLLEDPALSESDLGVILLRKFVMLLGKGDGEGGTRSVLSERSVAQSFSLVQSVDSAGVYSALWGQRAAGAGADSTSV